ncbi:hypothetical protein HYS30_00845 [Candidatus Peregrinibacteria bacterium]|nr:hypothetical protein [Candidatus Peregrinibacteria bacterium]
MRILFLNVASHSGLLACSTEERVLVQRAIDHRIGDHELVPLIEDTLHEAGWSYKDITHLACVIGPGGFTSLRVGVSCINALSWALKIPSTGIHLSDLYGARMPPPLTPPPSAGEGEQPPSPPQGGRGQGMGALWFHSTKRTELFVRGFGDFAKEWPEPRCTTLEDLVSELQSPKTYHLKPITYTGELLPEHRAAIEGIGTRPFPLAPIMKVLPGFLALRAYQEQILQPWYGRGW